MIFRLAIGLVMLLVAAPAVAAESPVGRWTTIDDETGKPRAVVRIWEEDGKPFGKIERIFLQPGEPENPTCRECEGDLRGKPIVGMVILRGLKRDGDSWSGGTILDPESGSTYKATIQVVDGGARLKVRGYVGISLFGRTQHWERLGAAAEEREKAPKGETAPRGDEASDEKAPRGDGGAGDEQGAGGCGALNGCLPR